MQLTIRPILEKDYPCAAEIYNELYKGSRAFSAEKIKAHEDRFPKRFFRKYSVAELDGKVVAANLITQDQLFSVPGLFFFNAWVHPEFHGRGIGSRLFDHSMGQLTEARAEQIQCTVNEIWEKSIRFLQKRGFEESYRAFESRMELARFNPSDYAAFEPRLERDGIALHDLRELSGPDHRRKIYELQLAVEREVPGAELRSVQSFEDFWAKVDSDLPDGEFFCVARRDGKYIGLHFGSPPPRSDWFMVRVTGVLKEHRQLGVAAALKARGMAYAKRKGMPCAFTWNDSRNQPILALNTKFGFQRQPASITFNRKL